MKKLFKNILMQFVFALSVFSIVGCQEYEMDSQPEKPVNMQVDAKEAYTMLATSPSNIAFGISSNTPWSISTDQQWCTVTPSSSAVSSLVSEVVISAESNETAKERTATITITGEGVDNKVIILTQKSKENLVVVEPSDVVPTDGDDVVFHIVSNKAWEVTTTDEFLNVMDKTKGEGDESGDQIPVTIKVPANAGALRTGHITVKTAFEEVTFEVTQDGIIIKMEEPTASGNIDFNGGPAEKIVRILANTEWKVKNSPNTPSWITATKVSNEELKVVVPRNDRLSLRSGVIELVPVKLVPGVEAIPFKVNQYPDFWFDCAEENKIVDEETGNVKIMQIGNNSVISKFTFTKGTLDIKFAGFHLKNNGGSFKINLWPNVSATTANSFLELKPGKENKSEFRNAGGYGWGQSMFTITEAQCNAISRIIYSALPDPANAGKLIFKVQIFNGEEKIIEKTNKGATDLWVSENPKEQGEPIYFNMSGGDQGVDFFTINTVTYTPAQ